MIVYCIIMLIFYFSQRTSRRLETKQHYNRIALPNIHDFRYKTNSQIYLIHGIAVASILTDARGA